MILENKPTQELKKKRLFLGIFTCSESLDELFPSMHFAYHLIHVLYSSLKKGRADVDILQFSSLQWLSRIWLFVTPWTAARFPVHHQLLESTQTHVHWVGDAIEPSHPLSSPSPPSHNPSQHQGLFQWVSSSHQVAEVLELQLQHQSFQWIFMVDFL